ncbi:uncharacterized protein [Clytia hemisphaerica]|uniref:uncharacterized protein n=1 Tax=Clytia hemisphaerica TaxID=252671 RepID=UPI0034D61808
MNQNPDQINQNPDQINQNPDQITQNPDQISQNPDQISQNPDQITQNPDQISQNPDQINQNPDQISQNPDLITQHPDQISQNPDQITQNPDQITQNPDQISQNPDQINQNRCNEQVNLEPMQTPLNDSGIQISNDLSIIDTDDEFQPIPPLPFLASLDVMQSTSETELSNLSLKKHVSTEKCPVSSEKNQSLSTKLKGKKENKPASRKKPKRPCIFCKNLKPQSRLKRHILTTHKNEPSVVPLLSLSEREQDKAIDQLRRDSVRAYNMKMLDNGNGVESFQRARTSNNQSEMVMCAGCKDFIAKSFKSRHQCPNSNTPVVPVVSINDTVVNSISELNSGFKDLLNTLHLDAVGNYIKTDKIILMVGERSYSAIKRKKDKLLANSRTVRSLIRLMARVYLTFKEIYDGQSAVVINDMANNASDMYRREGLSILAEAADRLALKEDETTGQTEVVDAQKSGLKISILNMIKKTGQYLIGNFLMKNEDKRSDYVVMFLKVLKGFENDLFGDAYYDIANKRNKVLRKPVNLPKEEDVTLLLNECSSIMAKTDPMAFPKNIDDKYTNIRAATVTCLIMFNARRGGEPSRLFMEHWNEALRGEWVNREDLPEEFDETTMLVTYQTGKGKDHLVPVIFPAETLPAIKYLADPEVRKAACVLETNLYLFPSTQSGKGHADGWQSIDNILQRLSLTGAINATRNRHRVASILARLEM